MCKQCDDKWSWGQLYVLQYSHAPQSFYRILLKLYNENIGDGKVIISMVVHVDVSIYASTRTVVVVSVEDRKIGVTNRTLIYNVSISCSYLVDYTLANYKYYYFCVCNPKQTKLG